nr:MAG TPA: hypothetical protein [Caudoviricetes sp.]
MSHMYMNKASTIYLVYQQVYNCCPILIYL